MFFYVIVYNVRTNRFGVHLSIRCRGSAVSGSINILLNEFVAYLFVFKALHRVIYLYDISCDCIFHVLRLSSSNRCVLLTGVHGINPGMCFSPFIFSICIKFGFNCYEWRVSVM
jgi:hypothetical protein